MPYNTTDLEQAIIDGGHELVQQIIEDSPQHIDPHDSFALRFAAEAGMKTVVEFLVTLGSDIAADNFAAIRYAAENGHVDVLGYLLSKLNDAEIKSAIDTYDGMALQDAVENGHIDCAKMLLYFGADHTLCYSFAIDLAISNGSEEMIALLVSYGSWDTRLDYKKYTRLFSYRHFPMVLNGTIKKRWVIKLINKDVTLCK